MKVNKENKQRKYIAKNNKCAKNFALPGCLENELLTPVLELCEEVYRLEVRGSLQEASKLLSLHQNKIERDTALDSFSKVESANLYLRTGSIVSALGNAQQIKNSQEEARRYLARAEDLFAMIGSVEGRAQCHNKLGVSYWQNGDLETAQIYFHESLLYAETDESKAIATLNIAMIESLSFRHASALKFYEKAYKFIGKISVFTEAKIRNGLGIVYKDLGNSLSNSKRAVYFDKAIIEFEGALICYEEIQNERAIITTQNNIGFLYSSIGLYDEAHQTLTIAESQARQTNDKNRLSIVLDTRARVLTAQGKYQEAIKTAAVAVSSLESLESSNLLVTALITLGIAFARNQKPEESKSTFERAKQIAADIQDFVMVAVAGLFALRENYHDYNLQERLSNYLYAVKHLSQNQEKDIHDALREMTKQIEAEIEPATKPDESISTSLPPSFSLDEKLREISRQYIITAIAETDGNQSRAAARLGMSRQTLVARIKKDFPDLFALFNTKIESPQKLELSDLRPLFCVSNQPDEQLALTKIQSDYDKVKKGDLLLIKMGIPERDGYVVIQWHNQTTLLIGFLRRAEEKFIFVTASGENFEFRESERNLIIGQVIGFCRHTDFQKFIARQNQNSFYDLAFEMLDA